MSKLTFYGISGLTNKWIHSFLSDRQQRVVINQEASQPLPVCSGVPQGTVLGPILFLAFINDMPLSVTSSKIRMFADDAIIYKEIKTPDDAKLLQQDLTALEKWSQQWRMEFNPSKCNSISFTRLRNAITSTYSLHQVSLEKVAAAKYLGVTLTAKLSWSEHVTNTVNKANRALGMIRRNINVAPINAKSQAYQTLVRPHLEYCSSVWDPHTQTDTDRIEAVQRRAARFCFRQYSRKSSPTAMQTDLGWHRLSVRREQARLILMFKLCHSLVNIDSSATLIPITRPTRHSHPYTYQRPAAVKNYHYLSFYPRTISQWNGLPASLVCAPTVEAFGSGLRTATNLSL